MHFVIIASRRTGSSHLVNTLGGHPEIFCHGNVFDPQIIPIYWPKSDQPSPNRIKLIRAEFRELRAADPVAFLERVFAIDHGRPNVGFKIFPGENDQILERLIGNASVRKIILFRRNVLAAYASQKAARKTGRWGVKKGNALPETPRILFKERRFVDYWRKYIGYYRNVIADLNGNHENFFFANYEDINEELILSSIVNFIGANGREPILHEDQRKQQVKMHPSEIIERFSNVDDVRKFLTEHKLLHWSYEGEGPLAFPQTVPDGKHCDEDQAR